MTLFPTSSPLEFIATDILGPLPKTTNVIQFVIFKTDRYSKLTPALATSKTSATRSATIFYGNWILPPVTPAYLLQDNGTQFVSTLFLIMIRFPGSKQLSALGNA